MSNYMTHLLSHKYSNWACDNQSCSRFVTVLIVMVIINKKNCYYWWVSSDVNLCLHAGCSDKEGKVEVSQSKIMEGKRKKILKYDWKNKRKNWEKLRIIEITQLFYHTTWKTLYHRRESWNTHFGYFSLCIMLYKNWWHSFYSFAYFKGCFFAVLCNRSSYMSVFLICWKM